MISVSVWGLLRDFEVQRGGFVSPWVFVVVSLGHEGIYAGDED